MSRIFHLSVIEMALVESAKELLSLQDLENHSKMFNMLFWCLSIHKNVVQVYQHALFNLANKDLVHERLKIAEAFTRPNGRTLNS